MNIHIYSSLHKSFMGFNPPDVEFMALMAKLYLWKYLCVENVLVICIIYCQSILPFLFCTGSPLLTKISLIPYYPLDH
jgi:hypothetical protein